VRWSWAFRVTSGVERRKIMASRTTKPRVSSTLTRTVIGSVRDRIGLGEKVTWSTTSRWSWARSSPGSTSRPFGSVITPAGPCGPCTAALGGVSRLAVAAAVAGVTRARIVLPTSPSRRT
jgi:hypothetical protein